MKRELLLIGFVILVSILFSCKKEIIRPTWTSYHRTDGLASDTVTCITTDAHGNVWFGSDFGQISKFDGTNWTTYGIRTKGVYVSSIAIDGYDNVWFATSSFGLFKFDGTKLTTYISLSDSTLPPNYDFRVLRSITHIGIDNQNNIWVSIYNDAIYKFDGTIWTKYNTYTVPGNDTRAIGNVFSIAIDEEGNKWFGLCMSSYASGAVKFDGTNWFSYKLPIGPVYSGSSCVSSIAMDTHNNKWFGTNRGILKLSGEEITAYTTLDGLPSNSIRGLVIDKQDNKWFLAGGTGIWKFNGKKCFYYTTLDGLVDNYVTALAVDAEGNKWFGTQSGVSKMHDN